MTRLEWLVTLIDKIIDRGSGRSLGIFGVEGEKETHQKFEARHSWISHHSKFVWVGRIAFKTARGKKKCHLCSSLARLEKKNREEMYHTSRLKTAEVRALSWRIDGVEIDTGLFFGKWIKNVCYLNWKRNYHYSTTSIRRVNDIYFKHLHWKA